jgi:hypothetical protein
MHAMPPTPIKTQPRCYTLKQVLVLLELPRRTFTRLRSRGALPFLEELLPRIGHSPRYKAEPIDRYLEGQWTRPVRFFGRRRAS